jgi:hypothetical protein
MRDPIGLGLGFSAGAMNTYIVMKVRQHVANKAKESV